MLKHWVAQKKPVLLDQVNFVKTRNVTQLKAALNVGPVPIVVSSRNSVFKNYMGGIIDSKNCSTDVMHAVLAVGYGVDHKSK